MNVGLSLKDRIEDFIGGGFDLAIRFGVLGDASLIARQLAMSHSAICAYPDYLDAQGKPETPDDLASHSCLTFRTKPGENIWQFEAKRLVPLLHKYQLMPATTPIHAVFAHRQHLALKIRVFMEL
ncbi:MAG: hypothetical protein JKX91_10510 [Rhizobiaceae bacterium]|nr:hypothetical protein [Rhizobiaceae bacterium]